MGIIDEGQGKCDAPKRTALSPTTDAVAGSRMADAIVQTPIRIVFLIDVGLFLLGSMHG